MSSINAGSPIYPGQTVVAVVTNATFTSAATATLRTAGGITQAQAKTFVNGTSFTLDLIVQGNLPFGSLLLRVNEGATTEDIAVTLRPITDNAYTNIVNPNITADSIFFNYAPYATITQVEYTEADLVYEIIDDHKESQNVLIYADGRIKWQRDISSCAIRLYDGTAWSSFETFTFNNYDAVTPPVFPEYCRAIAHQTLWQKFSNGHPYKYNRGNYGRPSFTTPVSTVGGAIAALVKDPGLHTRAASILPTQEFYSTLRNGITFKLFDLLKLRDAKQQANIIFNIGANQNDETRYEYKFRFENDFNIQPDPIIAGRSPREYFQYHGQFYAGAETDLGQTTVNFVEGGLPIKMAFHVINNTYMIQPYNGEKPQKDCSKWVTFEQGKWVGVIICTRWSRVHGGWHAVYIDGRKLYEVSGGSLPSSADVFFNLGITAYNLAWSRRNVSYKDVGIYLNPTTLFP